MSASLGWNCQATVFRANRSRTGADRAAIRAGRSGDEQQHPPLRRLLGR